MKLVDMKVNEFVEILGSNAPAPGGGSASALSGAQGIALAKMVATLTIGKKKYAEYEADMIHLKEEAARLQIEFVKAIDEDTEAFNVVSDVFKMPKETDEDKAKRKEALQRALEGAAISPYHLMELTVEALELIHPVTGKINESAASDLGVAALDLKAGIQGAWLNVLINLNSIKDKNFVDKYHSKGEKLLERGSQLADEIFNDIVAIL